MSVFEPTGKVLFAEGDPQSAPYAVFGIPYDGSTSFRPGARFGPEGIRQASIGLETYSPRQKREVETDKVADLGDVADLYGPAERVLAHIERASGDILERGAFPFALGGDHLVTLGLVAPLARRYPGLTILHFDGHTDLREDYLGEPLSHATVMRRCRDLLGAGRIFQFGIRSGTREEYEVADFLRADLTDLDEAIRRIGAAPAFLSFDVDAFDPSEAPGTGTPEPGGLTWREVEAAIGRLRGPEWVGADIVEVAPPLDPTGRTPVLAAKLMRELLILFQRSG